MTSSGFVNMIIISGDSAPNVPAAHRASPPQMIWCGGREQSVPSEVLHLPGVQEATVHWGRALCPGRE
ncbi:hypothetical protein CEXT_810301 [Caerostris extrusa]|uniref:Uncharacterized protein n=1 Tax=Caerostris extrusa TaxID=172846 RepID=A0AAV4UD34_CAEEX|nr:hypothetical protein CEXT_810301 [Caerostris extrusa]